METETLLQAILGGASMHRAPGMVAPYAALRTRLIELCSGDPTLANALLAFENHPTSTAHQAALEQRLTQLQLRHDAELDTAIQAVLAEVTRQEALGAKTTGSPVAERPGEIVCDRCGQPQPASRLVCWSCGREFIAPETAAVLRARAIDPGKTVRLPNLSTLSPITDPATTVNTEASALPELLQALKKISADQEGLRKAIETETGALRQLVGLQSVARPVIVQDFRMDFGSMVVFILKWTVAAIPALIVLYFALAILTSIFGRLLLSAMLR